MPAVAAGAWLFPGLMSAERVDQAIFLTTREKNASIRAFLSTRTGPQRLG